MVVTCRSGRAEVTPGVAARIFAAASALPPLRFTRTIFDRSGAEAPRRPRALAVSRAASVADRSGNIGCTDTAPTLASAEFTLAVRGERGAGAQGLLSRHRGAGDCRGVGQDGHHVGRGLLVRRLGERRPDLVIGRPRQRAEPGTTLRDHQLLDAQNPALCGGKGGGAVRGDADAATVRHRHLPGTVRLLLPGGGGRRCGASRCGKCGADEDATGDGGGGDERNEQGAE